MPSPSDPAAGTVVERLPALDGIAPADAADAFRDLPGLALLESARPGRTGRWSFLVAEPIDVLEGSDSGPDPFAGARALSARLDRRPLPPGAPPFAGGLVGHLGYDLGRRLERLPARALDDHGLPDLRLGLHAWAIAWDGRDGGAWLTGRAVDGDAVGLAVSLAGVRARAEAAVRVPLRGEPSFLRLAFRSEIDRAGWIARVEAVREAIAAGELYQANLTRRLVTAFDGEPWSVFRRLRAGEPSMFTAYVDLGRADGAAGPAPAAGGRSSPPRPSPSSPSTRPASSGPTRSRAPGRGAGPALRTARSPPISSPRRRTAPRTR